MSQTLSIRLSLDDLETISRRRSWVHGLDPRAKVLATVAFLVTVASFHRYAVLELLPLLAYPVSLCIIGRVPLGPLVKRLLVAAPFVVFLGALNPLFDTTTRLVVGKVALSGGVLSYASIVARFLLCTAAVLVLMATTGMNALCAGAERLGVPRLFVTQLAFLFRYLFVLSDEAARMKLAATLRSPKGLKLTVEHFGALAGQLLLRTLDRATRIQLAMQSRGFNGHVPLLRPLKLRSSDALFVAVWVLFFVGIRVFGLSDIVGRLALGGRA